MLTYSGIIPFVDWRSALPTIEYKIEDEVVLGSFRLTIYFKKDRNESRLGFVLTAEIHSGSQNQALFFEEWLFHCQTKISNTFSKYC